MVGRPPSWAGRLDLTWSEVRGRTGPVDHRSNGGRDRLDPARPASAPRGRVPGRV
ncbi:hypothetical protein ATKI12_5213 [Kitasatospora sp. Ki12]